jgi:hypothetical protein
MNNSILWPASLDLHVRRIAFLSIALIPAHGIGRRNRARLFFFSRFGKEKNGFAIAHIHRSQNKRPLIVGT